MKYFILNIKSNKIYLKIHKKYKKIIILINHHNEYNNNNLLYT